MEQHRRNRLDNIRLADPGFLDGGSIDILIGADLFWDLLSDEKLRLSNGPYLYNTKLGWIISGPIFNNYTHNKKIQCHFTQLLDYQLRMFWEIEELPITRNIQTDEERTCEEYFMRTTTRTSEGRFCVRIPLNQSPDVLGDSYAQAQRQFFALERRLQRSPDYRQLYTDFMQEYERLGHMSRVADIGSPNYFLSHHGVYREHSSTTKLRVVFNGSAATSSGKSLNDLQLVGPAIQGDLIAILLRFRQHRYVACADIEKMYRQCLVHQDQRNLQMILWRDDPSQELGVYELNTVTYGTASAPYLSVRCLKQLAIESSDPDVKRVINEDFYVDDLITSLNDRTRLLNLCSKIAQTLQSGCFPLRKWIFNFKTDDNNQNFNQSILLNSNDNISSKTLGLGWNSFSDEFYFNTQFHNNYETITKRSILSNISQIFDPLGLLCPTIIVAKVLLQQLWLIKLSWDDAVPLTVARTWKRFVDSLQFLNKIRIPRYVMNTNPSYIELHVFSDASQTAYGACIYIRAVDNLKVSVRLLIAKSKVAPLKPISIPRLELCGALLSARLYNKVHNSLHYNFDRVVFWSDSTIILGWLRMPPNKLKTFVQNRTAEIHELAKDIPWRHVKSKDNPADLASRGVHLEDLSSSLLWWEGPDFLRSPDFSFDSIETFDLHTDKLENLPDVRSAINSFITQDSQNLSLFPFDRFSQYNRMKRAMAFLLRFINNIKIKNNKFVGALSVDELDKSEKMLIRLCQIESFPNEYKILSNNSRLNNKNNLSKLNLFLDVHNIIRVGGRLNNSDFNYNKKHPILLSSKHWFSTLLFRYEHIRLLHSAPQALLFNLREIWWPIGGRNLARQVVHRCVICTRIKGKTLTPIIPKERVTPTYPFARCGVDYCGPVSIMNRKGRGAKIIKGYICLFVCFVTRAIHLELVSDLSSDAYLMALTDIYSDNGRNFVGLMNDFSKFLSNCNPDIIEYATNQQIKFHFIPVYSPHFGGLWERGVQSCKYHLRRVVGNAHLTFEEFSTVLTQIEAVLNSRPLSPLSPNPNDLIPLTPAHFLVGRPLTAPVSEDLSDMPVGRLRRYERMEQIRQHFWSRWATEYVSELQVRTKWKEHKDELKPDTLVVIKDSNLPPLKWHMGRVLRTIPGKDGVARVADIRTSSGVVRRAYAKICPLLEDVDENSP